MPEFYADVQQVFRCFLMRKATTQRQMLPEGVIKDFAYTITTRQDRTPAQVIDCGSGRYRYLTERGYTDEEFEAAKAVHERKGRYYMTLYKQAGNSIAVPIFESIFRKIILGEEKTKKDDSERQKGDAGR